MTTTYTHVTCPYCKGSTETAIDLESERQKIVLCAHCDQFFVVFWDFKINVESKMIEGQEGAND